ncbi:alpha/beta hydrolase [Pseudolabrys taiwanensis]|uniref:Alpha/beta hydrolase n=1 Tax=Pseudolabrys taiwanensis TaxID=331696 RepID=A0A345ZXB4_9HYPH|nr:alpha/beta hydrolase [Pseudolabrys taiwanensis]AXK81561.1 alpha/beta hydrolase [Pseudolabrys taiwanensis]
MTSHSRSALLIVPGIFGSGDDHWQVRWSKTLPNAKMVEQDDWDNPELSAWLSKLHEAIELNPGAILIGHSLGSILIAHLARFRLASTIAGALLVAPADVEHCASLGNRVQSFSPVPRTRLPFRSVVVGSTNDDYVDIRRSEEFSQSWGASFYNVGACGHINVASGFGDWVEGELLLEELRRVIADEVPTPARKAVFFKHLSH